MPSLDGKELKKRRERYPTPSSPSFCGDIETESDASVQQIEHLNQFGSLLLYSVRDIIVIACGTGRHKCTLAQCPDAVVV